MSIIKKEDFVGFYDLSTSSNFETLMDAFILKYENKCIYEIFGIKLGKLIIADIGTGTSPTNVDYKKVWDAFQEVGPSDEQWISEGVLSMIKAYVFWNLICETHNTHSQASVVSAQVDTGKSVDPSGLAQSRWNDMLDSWDAIKDYIRNNLSTYPDYVSLEPPNPRFGGIF